MVLIVRFLSNFDGFPLIWACLSFSVVKSEPALCRKANITRPYAHQTVEIPPEHQVKLYPYVAFPRTLTYVTPLLHVLPTIALLQVSLHKTAPAQGLLVSVIPLQQQSSHNRVLLEQTSSNPSQILNSAPTAHSKCNFLRYYTRATAARCLLITRTGKNPNQALTSFSKSSSPVERTTWPLLLEPPLPAAPSISQRQHCSTVQNVIHHQRGGGPIQINPRILTR